MKTIIYHDDNDGRLAAAILLKQFKGEHDPLSVVFIPATYDKARAIVDGLPEYDGAPGGYDEVAVVDFSFSEALFTELVKKSARVTWIDHHKSSIEALAGSAIEALPGKRDTSRAACILAWEYCFPNEETPLAVKLVADRDAWVWEFGKQTAEFHYGLSVQDTVPGASIWSHLLGSSGYASAHSIQNDGRVVMKALGQRFKEIRETVAFDTVIDGHPTRAMNIAIAGSAAFGAEGWETGALPDDVEICCQYYHTCGAGFTVSLYSPKGGVDVSELCKKRGGGGHANAAGFTSVELPDFLRPDVNTFRSEK